MAGSIGVPGQRGLLEWILFVETLEIKLLKLLVTLAETEVIILFALVSRFRANGFLDIVVNSNLRIYRGTRLLGTEYFFCIFTEYLKVFFKF